MNPKHVVNDKSTSTLFFGGDAVEMSCMSMSWRFERRPCSIRREVRGEMGVTFLHVSIHL
jgi:hypothetical protein